MSKNKNQNITIDKVTDLAKQAGVLLMTAAVTVGMLELPDHQNSKIVLPSQPVLVKAGENSDENNPIRREREEAAPHFISYSEVQRTPSRSGKQ